MCESLNKIKIEMKYVFLNRYVTNISENDVSYLNETLASKKHRKLLKKIKQDGNSNKS